MEGRSPGARGQALRPRRGRIVQAPAEAAGLDPARYAGHSLKTGFVTFAARSGADIWKIREVSRHKSLQVIGTCVRDARLFEKHAGEEFLEHGHRERQKSSRLGQETARSENTNTVPGFHNEMVLNFRHDQASASAIRRLVRVFLADARM